MARLKEYGKRNREMTTEHIEDVMGLELTITSCVFKQGQHGEFAVFDAVDENGVVHVIVSGAGFVLDALHDAEDQGVLSLDVNFYKMGNTVLFT